MPKSTYSPAGKIYKQRGDKGAEAFYAERQRTQRLERRIAALGKSETTTQKEQDTYVPTTGPKPFDEWKIGRTGSPLGMVRGYRAYEKNYGK